MRIDISDDVKQYPYICVYLSSIKIIHTHKIF